MSLGLDFGYVVFTLFSWPTNQREATNTQLKTYIFGPSLREKKNGILKRNLNTGKYTTENTTAKKGTKKKEPMRQGNIGLKTKRKAERLQEKVTVSGRRETQTTPETRVGNMLERTQKENARHKGSGELETLRNSRLIIGHTKKPDVDQTLCLQCHLGVEQG